MNEFDTPTFLITMWAKLVTRNLLSILDTTHSLFLNLYRHMSKYNMITILSHIFQYKLLSTPRRHWPHILSHHHTSFNDSTISNIMSYWLFHDVFTPQKLYVTLYYITVDYSLPIIIDTTTVTYSLMRSFF